ncbi:MAG: aminoglycoside N(3)-acetyltransferase [Verrucomicrobia bacterium]|nr:MAG: aminoglycoside N(3)-acetyltransferase [Verrucomicrobiota bacterium]
MSESSAIERSGDLPPTVDSLSDDLSRLGISRGSILLVHSSLSSLGWICGGAVAVIEALIRVIGPQGTLVMPTHTAGLSDPKNWSNPPVPRSWWTVIRENTPAFDGRTTPTRGMGAVAECFRNHSGVIRSHHPLVSFAALGPAANEITSEHELENGLGDYSPLGRIYESGGGILLLGVGHSNNTSLHLAEVRAYGAKHPMTHAGAPMMVDGRRQWVEFNEPEYNDDDFPSIGLAFSQETGLVRSGPVGVAKSMLMPQAPLVDFGVEWFRRNGKGIG